MGPAADAGKTKRRVRAGLLGPSGCSWISFETTRWEIPFLQFNAFQVVCPFADRFMATACPRIAAAFWDYHFVIYGIRQFPFRRPSRLHCGRPTKPLDRARRQQIRTPCFVARFSARRGGLRSLRPDNYILNFSICFKVFQTSRLICHKLFKSRFKFRTPDRFQRRAPRQVEYRVEWAERADLGRPRIPD